MTMSTLAELGASTYQPPAPVRLALGLRPGLLFMTLHFPDQVDINNLTIDAWDPKSGTAEFKATAVQVEKLAAPAVAAGDRE